MHEVVVDFAALVPQDAEGLMLACIIGEQHIWQGRSSTARCSWLKHSFRLNLIDLPFDLGAVHGRILLFCLCIQYLCMYV